MAAHGSVGVMGTGAAASNNYNFGASGANFGLSAIGSLGNFGGLSYLGAKGVGAGAA